MIYWPRPVASSRATQPCLSTLNLKLSGSLKDCADSRLILDTGLTQSRAKHQCKPCPTMSRVGCCDYLETVATTTFGFSMVGVRLRPPSPNNSCLTGGYIATSTLSLITSHRHAYSLIFSHTVPFRTHPDTVASTHTRSFPSHPAL